MSTKEELQAENERLGQENAGLRDLLAAVRAYAELPHPAGYGNYNSHVYECELERRVDMIAVWANGDQEDMTPGVYLLVMQDRAGHLREEAARPVRYEVRAEPAPGRDEPCSPDAAGVLAAAIAAGTPVTVTDDAPRECSAYRNGRKCELTAEHEHEWHQDELGNQWLGSQTASVTR